MEELLPSIVQIDLGIDGILYTKEKLERQKNALSTPVSKYFGTQGRVFTLLPEGTTLEQAKEFEYSMNMRIGEPHLWFANYITQRWGSDCQLVFEEPWLQLSDFIPHPPSCRYFTSHDKMYYVPEAANLVDALDSGEKEARCFLRIGFVIAPKVELPETASEATEEHMSSLIVNAQVAFISAYDEEGYIFWDKN